MNRYLLIASAAALVLAGCNKTGSSTAAGDAAASSTAAPASSDPVALAGSPSDADPLAKPAPKFIADAGVGDLYEIQAGQIALKKTKNGDVKGLAQMTIDDHTKSTEALKQAIKDSGRADLAAPTELSEEKTAMIDDLNKVPDTLFDTMYLTQQATVHADAENMLTAYAAHGDVSQLKDFAGKTAPVVQKHLDKIHEIQAKLAK
jgi:putative membrane protein